MREKLARKTLLKDTVLSDEQRKKFAGITKSARMRERKKREDRRRPSIRSIRRASRKGRRSSAEPRKVFIRDILAVFFLRPSFLVAFTVAANEVDRSAAGNFNFTTRGVSGGERGDVWDNRIHGADPSAIIQLLLTFAVQTV